MKRNKLLALGKVLKSALKISVHFPCFTFLARSSGRSELDSMQGTSRQTNYRAIEDGSQWQGDFNPQQPWMTVEPLPHDHPYDLDPGLDRVDPDPESNFEDILRPCWYVVMPILTVIFAIIATPLSLICFIPALKHLRKVRTVFLIKGDALIEVPIVAFDFYFVLNVRQS